MRILIKCDTANKEKALSMNLDNAFLILKMYIYAVAVALGATGSDSFLGMSARIFAAIARVTLVV